MTETNDPYSVRREKLVRDRVPELIRAAGAEPSVRVARDEQYGALLHAKLYEEAAEFAADPVPAELADLLEVVLAMADLIGCPPEELESARAAKAAERGGFSQRLVLGIAEDRTLRRPVVRKVRALLLDQDEILLLRRTRPGREPYWTTPGGRVEDDDPDLESALRRELWEELGGTVGPVRRVLTFTEQRPHADYLHAFYVCRLESMDVALRCGPEFDDPSRGAYDVDRFPCTPQALTPLPLWPRELRDYLGEQAGSLAWLAPGA
ncbi:MAG: NUDIX domain-containing protein [Streptosporangiaceae bacterium]